MRSTLSSEAGHDFAVVIKKLSMITLLALAVMAVLIPLSTSAVSEFSIFNVEYTHQQLKFRFAAENAAVFAGYAAFLAGAASGLSLFSFVLDRRRSAFYFSLGLSRAQLYIIRILAGALALFAVTAIPVAVSVILNIKALGGYEGMPAYAAAFFAALFLQSLCGLLIFAVACQLAGTIQEALLAGATLAAAPSVCAFFINALMKNFTWGNTFGASTYAMAEVRPSLLKLAADWNPLFMAQSSMEKYNSFSREMSQTYPDAVHTAPFLIWIVIIALGAMIAGALFNAYKAERSGIEGLFKSTHWLICSVWPLGAFAVCMEYTQMLAPSVSCAVSAAAAAAVYAVMQRLLRYREKSRFSAAKGCAALAAVTAVSAAAAFTGGVGMFYSIPDAADTQSVRIVYNGQLSFMPVQSGLTSNGKAKYYSGRVTLESDECISEVRDIDSMLQKQGRIKLKSGSSDDFSETVLPYDIHITYDLRSGKKTERYYDRITAGGLAKLLKLCDTNEMKRYESDVVKGALSGTLWNSAAFSDGDVYLADGWLLNIKKLDLSADYRKQLQDAIAADIKALDTDDLYHPATDVKAQLMFTMNGEEALDDFSEANASAVVYVTCDWKNTETLLESWGVMPAEQAPGESGVFSDVLIQKFDPYSSMNGMKSPVSLFFGQYFSSSAEDFILRRDFGNRPDINDSGQISELAAASRGVYYMDGGGYLLAFKVAGSDSYVYRFLPYDDAPEFIKSRM